MFRASCAVIAGLACAAALCWAGAVSADQADLHVGETTRVFRPAVARHWRGAKTEALVTRIWYPVDTSVPQTPREIGAPAQPIFHGHAAAHDAPLSTARTSYPLLVLSHGTGGTADSLDWLAAALAAQGYIVAGANHPGNNAAAPMTRDGFMLWWERAADASEVLDGVLADPLLGPHVDRERIGAVGFSLGGYTVLELAGARTNLPAFERFCASPEADAICHPPEAARISDASGAAPSALDDLSPATKASRARSGASYRDPRVKAVFAIAPALGEAFDANSFADVTIPVSLLAGEADVIAPVATNIHRIAGLLRSAHVEMVPGASHYTFLDTCLADVVARLAGICRDGPGVDRDAVHALAADRAIRFFAATLPAR
ncbi:putative dienelactone hydrolase [Paraburkholderia sp. BL6665CI2N2]|uniref:alpha/beta hydrolase family protein n=1 Tax=Paraburkholderia sp. BL6665CI2N2 TaxID=1938806 RepID=UPI001066AA17|nr:peptidase [Paraburkholderia sp. BL6665CI2N2]TDY21699.1 putative dienelactone hydrolase [Paraburkholderia sp. BL6665CI2N2]